MDSDLSSAEKHDAVLETYKHRGLTPGMLLAGAVEVEMPLERYSFLLDYYLRERKTPADGWRYLPRLGEPNSVKRAAAEKRSQDYSSGDELETSWNDHIFWQEVQLIDVGHTIPLDPTTIDIYQTPVWESVHALEKDLAEDPQFVNRVLMSTGINEAEIPEAIEAQKATIKIHYNQ